MVGKAFRAIALTLAFVGGPCGSSAWAQSPPPPGGTITTLPSKPGFQCPKPATWQKHNGMAICKKECPQGTKWVIADKRQYCEPYASNPCNERPTKAAGCTPPQMRRFNAALTVTFAGYSAGLRHPGWEVYTVTQEQFLLDVQAAWGKAGSGSEGASAGGWAIQDFPDLWADIQAFSAQLNYGVESDEQIIDMYDASCKLYAVNLVMPPSSATWHRFYQYPGRLCNMPAIFYGGYAFER